MKGIITPIIAIAFSLFFLGLSQPAKADDLTSPVITQISSLSADGYYKENNAISVVVDFSEPIYTVGTTTLVFNSGILTHCDFSVDLSLPTSTVSCIYTIAGGDSSADLDTRSDLSSGSVYDVSGNLMSSFTPNISLASLKDIVVDTNGPNVAIDSSTADGYYDVGDTVVIDLDFSELIYSIGDITVNLNASSTANCVLQISSSTPSRTGSCNYIVRAGDDTSDLSVNSVSGDIFDLAGHALNPTPSWDLSLSHEIIINTDSPRILEITSSDLDAYYKTGQSITIDLLFSEAIYSVGDITLNLNANSTANCVVSIDSLTPTTTASCVYTVSSGDSSADLNVSSVSGNIFSSTTLNQLVNFNIRDESLTDNSNLVIDSVLPTILSIRLPTVPDGSYNSGTGPFIITFSEAITTTATSTIYFDASGTASCVFSAITVLSTTTNCSYTIGSSDNSSRLYITSVVSDIYDQAGNQTTNPSADDIYFGNRYIVIDTIGSTAVLYNTPASSTTLNEINITVGGDDIQYFKYKLDDGSLSLRMATSTVLSLSNMSTGNHTLYIIGRDSASNWQDLSVNPTTFSWTITSQSSGGGGGGGGAITPSSPAPQVLGVKIYSYASGRMVKTADSSAVYHITDDGKRHLYPNSVTYWTWHNGTWSDQNIEIISQADFDALLEGEHVTVKPDSKLIRFYNSPRAYTVSDGSVINYVTDEVALELYGKDWKKNIIMIQNGFETDYTRGEQIVL